MVTDTLTDDTMKVIDIIAIVTTIVVTIATTAVLIKFILDLRKQDKATHKVKYNNKL